ncbi:hypothetical protein JTE90_015019 [Oedothorax gibbosus]|uniref:Uncharacterized protein n=1 Tax=Oedothorax gibbosus TaxID=931172 RepID=A0AAV6TVE3_9ARAC|nr:hypothetical protein JTE90_015019 [Oedothorax gibbosus]
MAESNEKATITEELKALREQLKEAQEVRIQQYEARICQYEKQIETDGVWRTDMAMELKAVRTQLQEAQQECVHYYQTRVSELHNEVLQRQRDDAALPKVLVQENKISKHPVYRCRCCGFTECGSCYDDVPFTSSSDDDVDYMGSDSGLDDEGDLSTYPLLLQPQSAP